MMSKLTPGFCIRSKALLIGAVTFLSYAYFHAASGWNENSRFDLVRAILEHQTLSIDAYQENTEDKAIYQGHYYSDKAPGLALLALPAAAATKPVLRTMGVDPSTHRGLVATAYVATLFSVALPAALGCVALFLIAMKLGTGANGAVFAALGMGLGTPLWAYSTLFWGHPLAAACLLGGFAAALMVGRNGSARADGFWALATGLAAGWATVTEYPAAPASAILAVLALGRAWSRGGARRWCTAGGLAAGALACAVVLAVYQRTAFGSAFHPSYSYYGAGAFPWMKFGFMGLRYPRIDVMLKLLLSCYRGLFAAAPVTAAAPLGLRLLWKRTENTSTAAAATAIAGYYLLFNASFSVWDAGWSYGPRYMAAGVPALCIGLAPLWDTARPRRKTILAVLAAASIVLNLVAASTAPNPPNSFSCPMAQLLWPSFWAGKLSLNLHPLLGSTAEAGVYPAFNLGELMGLRGLRSLIPLLALWAVAIILWIRIEQADRKTRNRIPSGQESESLPGA